VREARLKTYVYSRTLAMPMSSHSRTGGRPHVISTQSRTAVSHTRGHQQERLSHCTSGTTKPPPELHGEQHSFTIEPAGRLSGRPTPNTGGPHTGMTSTGARPADIRTHSFIHSLSAIIYPPSKYPTIAAWPGLVISHSSCETI